LRKAFINFAMPLYPSVLPHGQLGFRNTGFREISYWGLY